MKDAQTDAEEEDDEIPEKEDLPDPLRDYVRLWCDRIGWCRDVIVSGATAFAALLFGLAGLCSGYSLLFAMQGKFGTLGCAVAVIGAGAAVAWMAYCDSVDEKEAIEIEAEAEAEYRVLKDEEQRLIKQLYEEAEDREIDAQLRSQRRVEKSIKKTKEVRPQSKKVQELEQLDEAEGRPPKAPAELNDEEGRETARIERLRGIRDRLEKMGMKWPADAAAKLEPAPEMEAEAEKIPLLTPEPAEEPPPDAPSTGMEPSADAAVAEAEDVCAAAMRRATLRHRVAAAGSAAAGAEAEAER